MSASEGASFGEVNLKAMRLCVLLASFNRCELTLKCLRALKSSVGLEGVNLHALLVDDGSTDGTPEAVREQQPWVQVYVNQDAPLFWCRAMHRALALASEQRFDAYLLLNDDTELYPDALARLLACAKEMGRNANAPVLVVGSCEDAESGELTYGGERLHSKLRPTRMLLVPPSDVVQRLDTFNGNIVLLPADVVAIVGNLDPVFEHAMGDTDYGLRARRAGVALWLAPGFHGRCSSNSIAGTFSDETLAPRLRWRHMLGRKGLPWRSWMHFTRRHATPFWPAYFVRPYLRLVMATCSYWMGSKAADDARR